MKKSYNFNVLSNTVCKTPGCNKRLKQRIVENSPATEYCYQCHVAREARKGHSMGGRKVTKTVEG